MALGLDGGVMPSPFVGSADPEGDCEGSGPNLSFRDLGDWKSACGSDCDLGGGVAESRLLGGG